MWIFLGLDLFEFEFFWILLLGVLGGNKVWRF